MLNKNEQWPKYYIRLQEIISKESAKCCNKIHTEFLDYFVEIKTGKEISDYKIIIEFENRLTYHNPVGSNGSFKYFTHENLNQFEKTYASSIEELIELKVLYPYDKFLKNLKVVKRELKIKYGLSPYSFYNKLIENK